MIYDKFVFDTVTLDKAKLTSDVEYTQKVNSADDLTLGSACSCEVVFNCINFDNAIPALNGKSCTYYKVLEDGTEKKIGVFVCQKPERNANGTYKLTAYDHVLSLEKTCDDWISAQTSDLTLLAFAQACCTQCGLTFSQTSAMLNSDFVIPAAAIAAIPTGLTFRKLIQYAAEAAGCYARANADGEIEFAWYSQNATHEIGAVDKEKRVYPDFIAQEPIGTGAQEYHRQFLQGFDGAYLQSADGFYLLDIYALDHNVLQGSLSVSDYSVAKINQVRARQSDKDVGVYYPASVSNANTYVLNGNPILATDASAKILPLVTSIYARLSKLDYRPCEFTIFETEDVNAGDIVNILNPFGNNFSALVMECTRSGNKSAIKCTGSEAISSPAAIVQSSEKRQYGKLLEISATADALVIEAKDLSESKVGNDEVRSKFALDSTSVSIESGTISFKSNTFTLDSTNCTIAANGDISATGNLRTANGRYLSHMWGGELDLYKDDTLTGRLYSVGTDTGMYGIFQLWNDGQSHITMLGNGDISMDGNLSVNGSLSILSSTTLYLDGAGYGNFHWYGVKASDGSNIMVLGSPY